MAADGELRRTRPRHTQVVRRIGDELRAEGGRGFAVVPFVRGRRPTDEARHRGLGSSDHAALICGEDAENRAHILFTLPPTVRRPAVDATLSFTGHDGSGAPATIPNWRRRPVPLGCFDERGDGSVRAARAGDGRYVLALDPERDLWPGTEWRWDELAPGLRAAAAGDEDPYGFGHLFLQRVRVELRLLDDGGEVATAETAIDVCDVRRLGSLYARILERLVGPDTARQAAAAGVASPGRAYHPWFPVLLIGADKASLYTRGLVADIVRKERYLAEPAWLLRIGVYLELLTCLGIAEAVRGEVGDVLTAEERVAFASERYAPIRERIDPDAWRAVWELRELAFPHRGVPRAGPVSHANLLHKKRATLAFLHAHHEDLKQAIALAGPNRFNAQETWQRVFRDAERAVLRRTAEAFPELGYLPRQARDFVLWHRQGRLSAHVRVPRAVAALFADQDGLYASACSQYRASMNHVAAWAKSEGLMDPSGRECVPRQVSLLEARLHRPDLVAALQRRDGYAERLDVTEALDASEPPVEDAEQLLATVPIFALLDAQQLGALARSARPLALGPTERFVIQGSNGTSLFVVADGEVEVLVRRVGGPDLRVATLARGSVVGEMALLTGEPRRATVRAVDGALVYEIGRAQYEPLLRAHREWVDELATLMEERLRAERTHLAEYDAQPRRHELATRIRRHFFGRDVPHAAAPAD